MRSCLTWLWPPEPRRPAQLRTDSFAGDREPKPVLKESTLKESRRARTVRPMTDHEEDEDKPAPTIAKDDVDQVRKDRSYSPSSGRETEELQREPTIDDAPGNGQLPGTGGPDDGGDIGVPDDDIDAAVIRERSEPD